MSETVKTVALLVAGGAVGLAIGEAYDRAKKAWNKKFPDYKPLVQNNYNVSIVGFGIICASVGYFFGKDLPAGANLPTLAFSTGCALLWHDNLINSFGVLKELLFHRGKKQAARSDSANNIFLEEKNPPRENEVSITPPGRTLYATSNFISKWGDKIPAVIDFVLK